MNKLAHATDESSLKIEIRRMLDGGHTKDEVLADLQEWCESNVEKVFKFSGCPKCGWAADDYLSAACRHKFCPLRCGRDFKFGPRDGRNEIPWYVPK